MRSLMVAAAQFEINWVGAPEVIDAAANVVGDDAGPGLTALASAGKHIERAELTPLITEALGEVGHGVMNEHIASRVLVLAIADDIVGERIEPLSGARDLWRLAREQSGIEESLSLSVFIHLASEDGPDDETEAEVRRAASALLAGHVNAE